MAAWGTVFLAVWLLISLIVTAIGVGPFVLFRAYKLARLVALALVTLLAGSWGLELITLLSEDVGLGRRWAPIVINPILMCGPIASAWAITRCRLARPARTDPS